MQAQQSNNNSLAAMGQCRMQLEVGLFWEVMLEN